MRTRPKDRQQVLQRRQREKMAYSSHAYVRGSTAKFYEWLDASKPGSLPDGPPVWICGDCHVGNLGPVADVHGEVEIQIRDLDQTVVGNPAHDLIRLGLSLASAARGSDLPGVTTAHMLEQMVLGYTQAMTSQSRTRTGMTKPIRVLFKRALRRRWKHLAEERIEDVRPTIPMGKRFWSLAQDERTKLQEMFAQEDVRKLITCMNHRADDAKVEFLDGAYWMKGCSSLGRLRFAALLEVGKTKQEDARYCLMDIKEAVSTAAPRAKSVAMPKDFAVRVVKGACALSPNLGQRMLPTHLLGKPVVVRELMPQDLKLEMSRLSHEDAVKAARYLASVVGKAHARQMDAKMRSRWKNELLRNHSRKLDAPSWLWTSVVQLLSIHELAYLEHCRIYATHAD